LAWFAAAPLALLMLGALLVRDGRGIGSTESIAYLAVVALGVALRYLDIFRYGGATVQGTPASRDDWHRYRVRFPAIALAGWLAALWLGEQ
jgi:hypothetical protein